MILTKPFDLLLKAEVCLRDAQEALQAIEKGTDPLITSSLRKCSQALRRSCKHLEKECNSIRNKSENGDRL